MRFLLEIGNHIEGPFARDEIEDLHGAGIIDRKTKCRAENQSEWSTVYNLVPTAIWITTWQNTPPNLKQDSVSHGASSIRSGSRIRESKGFLNDSGGTPEMLVIAGWVCAGIALATFWMWSDAIKFIFPTLAVGCGLAVIILKKPSQGVSIVIAAALAMIGNELYVRHQVNKAVQQIEASAKSAFKEFEDQMRSVLPKTP